MFSKLLTLVIFATICACTFASTKGLYDSQQGRNLQVQVAPEPEPSTELAASGPSAYWDWFTSTISNTLSSVKVTDLAKSSGMFVATCLSIFTFYTFSDWAYKTLKGLETRGAQHLAGQIEAKERSDKLTEVDRKKRMIDSAEVRFSF